MLAFQIDQVVARADQLANIFFSDNGALANAAIQSKTSPYWSLNSAGQYVYNKKMFVDDLARAMIDRVVLTIGGYDIEELTGQFMHVWDHLSRSKEKSRVDNMPAAHGGVTGISGDLYSSYLGDIYSGLSMDSVNKWFTWNQVNSTVGSARPAVNTGANAQTIYVPLDFNFTSAYGLALPMIALQFHDVKITVYLRNLNEVSILQNSDGSYATIQDTGMNPVIVNAPGVQTSLLARYFFLDDAERKQFALNEATYLMTETQNQEFAVNTTQNNQVYSLYLNHPSECRPLLPTARDRPPEPSLSHCSQGDDAVVPQDRLRVGRRQLLELHHGRQCHQRVGGHAGRHGLATGLPDHEPEPQ